jgi:hypothetical protein
VSGRPLVRRRTAVAGALAALVGAGCDTGDDLPSPDGSASPSSSETPSAQPEQTPDETLLDEVLGQLTAALAVLTQARKAPLLRGLLTPLVKAHRRHVEVLEGEPATGSPQGPSPDPATMLRLVHQAERQLHTALVDAAGKAESGALAKLLASMSASVTQHLLVLPQQVAR